MKNFKNIHIGEIIKTKVEEEKVDLERIYSYFNYSTLELEELYNTKNLDTDILLKWSKFLKYDFFRLYSQHLILYAPVKGTDSKNNTSNLPVFRKNIYTKEIISFILEMLHKGTKTKVEIIDEYRIPKSTLHKWINKYSISKN